MNKKTAIVVGTGAGGAQVAKKLQGDYQVTMLEAGKEFKPFHYSIDGFARLRKSGMFFDERLIRLLLPNMIVDKSEDMVMVYGKGVGGTTTLATGNAVRYDGDLKKLGIDLDDQFTQLYKELPITTHHQYQWTDTTKKMYQIFEDMGLNPIITPKFLRPESCIECGHCAIGCPTGAKWDTRELVTQAVENGATLITDCTVTDIKIEDGKAIAVNAKHKGRKTTYEADVIVLAAGGFNTPLILEHSGIECDKTLFVDPVLCVAGELDSIGQDQQILMPFISQQDGYILSPYMDYLSFFFNKKWHHPMKNIASMMIKLADVETGYVTDKAIHKQMTGKDNATMAKAIGQSREFLARLGIPEYNQFMGTLNAGHPGGMLPLKEEQKDTLHDDRLPANLYVADATILPKAMGNPPILTIMALAGKIADIIKEQ